MATIKKGFTLIELTVSMGVLALIVGLTAGVLISVVKSYQKQRVLEEIERNGDFISRTIEESLRGAQGITCLNYDKTEHTATDVNGSIVCDLGAGELLFVENGNTGNKYFGNGYDDGGVYHGNCTPATNNCYAFALDDPADFNAAITITGDENKLTNADGGNGVNVSKFIVLINDGGATGAPDNIAVTIDVKGPVGSALFKDEIRTFQSFLTLRGTY